MNRTRFIAAPAALSFVLAGSCGKSDSPQQPQEACRALAGQTVGEATLTSAVWAEATAGAVQQCKVAGSIRSELKFEVTLPAVWNRKLLYGGGGGWDGAIMYFPLSPSAAAGGYVTVASNGGHSDPSGAVFLNSAQARQDFGYLSIHTVLQSVNQLVRQYYGADPEHRYFEGCSNGGREALIEASRHPADFDGIIARAPAYSFTELVMAFSGNMKRVLGTPGGGINAAKAATIASAVLKDCDILDGVNDGVVSNPGACAFDPAKLLCSAAESDACLTSEQVTTAKTIYGETKLPDGTSTYPGWGPGGEDLGWPGWLISDGTMPALQQFFAESLIRYWVVKDAKFDALTFDASKYKPQLAETAQTLDASPDLRAFFARNGKLILAHGTSDWAISYKGSIKYWNGVGRSVGDTARDAGMEFFLQPGVQHCFTGAGPDTVDLLGALSAWVESGQRPSSAALVSSKLDATGKPTVTRPLCRYPQYPRYSGSGSQDSASSYTCVNP